MPGISAGWTLARYFSARFFLAMMAMFLVCCVLIFFVDFIEMLRRAGNYAGDIPGFLLAWITLLRLPSFSELVLPFAVLIGSIGIFLMLSRSSELVVLRAAGISVWQFTLPAMVVAFLLGIAFVLIYNPIAAVARGEAERLYGVAFGKDQSLLTANKNAGAWLREDGTDGPTVIHAADVLNQGLELNGVTAFQYDRDHGLTERIEAKRATLKDGRWELEDAWVSAVGQEPELYKRYLLSTYLTPTQVRDSLGTVFSISFWDLPNFIEIAERAGLPATQYRVQYQLLLSRPFLLVTMVLIAATCSLKGFRFGNVQINAIIGLCRRFWLLRVLGNVAQLRHGRTDLGGGGSLGPGDHRGVARAHRALVQRGRVMLRTGDREQRSRRALPGLAASKGQSSRVLRFGRCSHGFLPASSPFSRPGSRPSAKRRPGSSRSSSRRRSTRPSRCCCRPTRWSTTTRTARSRPRATSSSTTATTRCSPTASSTTATPTR